MADQSFQWDIRRKGHAWGKATMEKYLTDYPEKPEVVDGKLFWSEKDRLNVLAMLLENVGVDKAIRLGDPRVWRAAIQGLEDTGERRT
jgi:hypothetical protein